MDFHPTPPPHNIEIEQAFLGALLLNNRVYDMTVELLRPEHFYDPLHSVIYDKACTIISAGQTANQLTMQHLCNGYEFKAVGGAQYLADLASSVITVVNAPDYARTIKELALRRQLLDMATTATDIARNADNLPAALGSLSDTLGSISSAGAPADTLYSMPKALDHTFEYLGRLWRGEIKFLSLGYAAIDDMLELEGGTLTIIAARPGMGKTAIACNMAYRMAKAGDRVLFFTLEMPVRQLTQRFICVHDDINYHIIKHAKGDDITRLSKAGLAVAQLPLSIDDASSIGLPFIEARSREVKRRTGLDCIFIDYLGLLTAEDPRAQKVHQIEQMTQGLKSLSKKLDIPIILLCQLSRAVEGREDKTPMKSDLRDSGAIEQDADNIIFLHRPDYYLGDNPPERMPGETQMKHADRLTQWELDKQEWTGKARVLIAKQRNGREGSIKLGWRGAPMIFDDLN